MKRFKDYQAKAPPIGVYNPLCTLTKKRSQNCVIKPPKHGIFFEKFRTQSLSNLRDEVEKAKIQHQMAQTAKISREDREEIPYSEKMHKTMGVISKPF